MNRQVRHAHKYDLYIHSLNDLKVADIPKFAASYISRLKILSGLWLRVSEAPSGAKYH
jgi:orotidine-5'-phosphate decarboxylase